MAPIRYANSEFDRQRQSWIRMAEFDGDLDGFSTYLNQLGEFAAGEIKKTLPEIRNSLGATSQKPGAFKVGIYQGRDLNFISLAKAADPFTLVWSCWQTQKARDEYEGALADGKACLEKLAALARGGHQDVGLNFPEQEDRAFMWKAPAVHPLQVLENAFQRIVHREERKEGVDPIKAQSEALADYFMQNTGQPARFQFTPPDQPDGPQLASVRMNHLIETFYLFRLLVQYQAESEKPIDEDLRVDLSGNLTKLLHNGDRATMAWLAAWLTEKIAQLGIKINALNKEREPRVLFFLKGGRALNYFLGTPEKGENDWDTQVVINPNLPAEEWYQCFRDVHDVLLSTLQAFRAGFTLLVKANAPAFTKYLDAQAGPRAGDDEEIDENEFGDVNSRIEQASCKAELIDIGIPRRGSASGLEEWTRLSAPGALKTAQDEVIYPHREYYLNEYLMMIRQAFVETAGAKKAPKRITRFGLILASDAEPSHEGPSRLETLPKTFAVIENLNKARRELFTIMMSQFVQAYNLVQDRELAALFDTEASALAADPPKLPVALAGVLEANQSGVAADVGVAHALSELMQAHWGERSKFFDQQNQFFAAFLRELSQLTNEKLQTRGAQFAIAGSYAARLHAGHLRFKPVGLEPIRRILVKLQCPHGQNEADVLSAVRDDIVKAAEKTGNLQVADVPDAKKRSLVLNWRQKVAIGTFSYAPLVMKIRGAAQPKPASQLPVLASIDGLPVLDLRLLAADYLKKSAKIDERGSRETLKSAAAAVSEMMSRFKFDSDDNSD